MIAPRVDGLAVEAEEALEEEREARERERDGTEAPEEVGRKLTPQPQREDDDEDFDR